MDFLPCVVDRWEYRIIFILSWLIRGAFRRRSAGGAGWRRLRAWFAATHPGRLRVSANKCTQFAQVKRLCRGHYGPLPSMAGLGQASGGEIPLRSGRRRAGRHVPGSFGPADENRRVRSAGRRRAIRQGSHHCPAVASFGAPPPRRSGRAILRERDPACAHKVSRTTTAHGRMQAHMRIAEHPFMHALNLHLKMHSRLRRTLPSSLRAWNAIAI